MSKEVKTQEPTKSNKKYIVLAIVVILGAVGIMLGNGKEDETATATVATTEQAPVAEQTSVTEKNTIAEETPAEIEPTVARIDITTPLVNADEPQFEVYVDGSEKPFRQARQMNKLGLQGYVVRKDGNNVSISIKALQNAEIKIVFKGPWDKDENGKMVEHWVDYTSIMVNDEEILSQPIATWHNKSFKHTIDAKAGNEFKINVKWQKHKEK